MSTDGTWKTSIITVSISTYLVSCGALAFAYYSNWGPFRARQLHVLLLSQVSSLAWNLGLLNSVNAFNNVPPFHVCYFFNNWLYVIFGVVASLAIMNYRLLRLYFIGIKRTAPSGILFWPFLIIPVLISFIMGLIPLFVSDIMLIYSIYDYETNSNRCNYISKAYLYSLYSVPLYFFGMIALLVYKLRHIKKAFNEYKELRIACFLCLICMLLNFIFSAIVPANTESSSYLSIMIFLTSAGGNLTLFWSILIPPLYGYLFKREAYLDDFEKSLKADKMNKDNHSCAKLDRI